MRSKNVSNRLFLVSFTAFFASASAQCIGVVEFICRVSTLSMLCACVTQAGLGSDLNKGRWTLFAPTNEAFFNLGDRLGTVLGNTDVLSNVILYHAVDEILYADDLTCSGPLQMASGERSRTECQKDTVYQKGEGNSLGSMARIVASNIDVCNGILHMVDEVLLPASLGPESLIPSGCKTIADIICESSLFSTLCAAVTQAGLRVNLSGSSWTLFAPTNDAFAKLGVTLNAVLANNALLTDILLTHTVNSVVYSSSLECGGSVIMANGQETTTVCHADSIFQTVNGNEAVSVPQITLSDIHACNGVIHLLNEVLIPNYNEPDEASVDECRSIAEIACSNDNFSTLCTAVTLAGLEDTLSKGSWTIFAPTNVAFSNLGATLDTVLADNDLLTDILLYHVAEGVVYSTDLACNGEFVMANGIPTLTVCENDNFYINGEANDPDAMPLVVLVDIAACNGVIHAVDEVILP